MIRLIFSLLALFTLAGLIPGNASVALQQSKVEVQDAKFQPDGAWTVSSPVSLTVTFKGTILLATWQWVGADGKPAQWLGSELPPFDMKPLGGSSSTWAGRGSAPPVAGSYKVKLTARPAGSQAGTAGPEQSIVLPLTGEAKADDKPFTRGFVFARDRNLWVRSTDLKRDREVTFYAYPASAYTPAWSPDGRWIAYILDPGSPGSSPELWMVRPDGTGARRVTTGDTLHVLGYPLFALDGTLLVCKSRDLMLGGELLGQTWDMYKVDTATNKLTLVQQSIYMPSISGVDGRVVGIRDTPTSDGDVEQSLVVSDLDGGNERTLVSPDQMDGFSAPAWSPDGTKVVFASRGVRNRSGSGRVGLAMPLLHGGVWDLYVVPAAGGKITFLSGVQEDLPYPIWPLDGSEVYFISPTGFWGVPATGGPPQLLLPNDAHSEMGVFAPQPRPAQPLTGAEQCFSETKQCLHGVFLQYWSSHGGLTQFGFPVSPELIEEGRTVQYLERARFEWHTENKGTQYEVLAGRLGADTAYARTAMGEKPFAQVAKPSDSSIRYFPETGHTLAAPLRAYWEDKGGLPVFGYPLSEAFQEKSATDGKTYLVQYFERNRLEYHPENKGTPNEVLLGLLGMQEYGRRYR